MFQANTQVDPLITILRLAYLRGLAIQREQEGKGKSITSQPPGDETPASSQECSNPSSNRNELQTLVGK